MEQLHICLPITVLVAVDVFQGAVVVYNKQNAVLWKEQWRLLDLIVAFLRTSIPRIQQKQQRVVSTAANPAAG